MKRDAFTENLPQQMQTISAPKGMGRKKKFKRDNLTLNLDLGHELIIDNFAGGGGTSEGLEQAFGRPVDIAINHNAEALAMHAVNHPYTKHLCESVWDVDPIKVTNNQPVALVWLSPDCFPAGTMVLTSSGYKAIETIAVGDQVLTHKQRWRAVTETSQATRPIVEIRGHGHPGLRVSPEHPFYVKHRQNLWNNELRQSRPVFGNAEWAPASVLEKDWYWSTPTSIPKLPIPEMKGSEKGTALPVDEKLLWLAGYYVGNGWTRLSDTRAELVMICGKHKADMIGDLLDQWPRSGVRVVNGELAWNRREVRTAIQFTANSRALVTWLRENFGKGAARKGIPAWLYGASDALKKAFLAGYLGADGWNGTSVNGYELTEATTVSKALAFGIKTLVTGMGYVAGVYRNDNQTTNVIEGRTVNVRPIYKIRWREAPASKHAQTFVEDGLLWSPVRDKVAETTMETVHNIGVDEDESYVVEGIIVHNCKHFSKAKGGKPVEKKIRGLAWVALRWAAKCKPRVIALENVEEFKTWGPLMVDENGDFKPDPTKKGHTFRSFIRQLEGHGYTVEYNEMRACDWGTPTIRKRFFLVARRDGLSIKWPAPTHGNPKSDAVKSGQLKPWRTAAECIDWDMECKSIFDRTKPLAEATMRRIAKGIMRYVVNAPEPFIVGQGGPLYSAKPVSTNQPFGTLTTENHRAIVVPTVAPVDENGELITSAALIQTGYGEREGQAPRALDIEKPLGTIVGAGKHAVATAFLSPFYSDKRDTDARGTLPNEPVMTIPTENRHALVTAFLSEHANATQQRNMDVKEPLRTICAQVKGGHFSAVTATLQAADGEAPQELTQAAFLAKHYTGVVGSDLNQPIGTVTSTDHHSYVVADLKAAHMEALYSQKANECRGSDVNDPVKTVTASARHAVVTSELIKIDESLIDMIAANIRHDLERKNGCITGNERTDCFESIGGEIRRNNLETCETRQSTTHCSYNTTEDRAEIESRLSNGENGMAGQAMASVGAHCSIQNTERGNPTGNGHQSLGWQQSQQSSVKSGNCNTFSELETCVSNRFENCDKSVGNDFRPSESLKNAGPFIQPDSKNTRSFTNNSISGNAEKVTAFLMAYYGTDQDARLEEPLHTVTTKERYGLVTIHGQDYQIVDIKLRMLAPRELFRAQGFPESYIIGDDESQGLKLPKSAQVRMCGNSVCPPLAKALIEANFMHEREFANAA